MAEFHTYLTYDSPALAESDPEKESVVDGVKAQVGAEGCRVAQVGVGGAGWRRWGVLGGAGGGEGWRSSYAHREDSRWHDRVGEQAVQWAVSPA